MIGKPDIQDDIRYNLKEGHWGDRFPAVLKKNNREIDVHNDSSVMAQRQEAQSQHICNRKP